ncbi:YhgE/Pip domain-containing protein [Cellulomonas alba]|uniref:YhgE/Pip domain-containing protein n=1 Tax=Cellulomonas alba TaxID=3053467 RepID=A0ABT7SC06_9CELL|nr:YhgE/Pip domain-containing protein [Cellulomonas alba]MDM7853721.1 YhgE/Pip domain-containing protein [Cellulomonas alba]
MLSLTSGTELRRFRRGTLPKLAVVVMLGIPLLYGALYLWAFWNPTQHLDRLPVALVDLDRGATVQGEPLHAGHDVVERLVASGDLDWAEVPAARASDGVRAGDYYFAVTVPADFSSALASAGGDAPRSARLEVTYDDANSYLATTLGRSAMQEVRDAVAVTAGEQAVDRVLVGLGKARDGMADASDGAVRLADAADTLGDGLRQVASGAAAAHDGAATIAAGAAKADDGAATLAAKADDLSTGTAQLADGASAVAGGAGDVQAAAGRLADGTAQVAAGVHETVGEVDALADDWSVAQQDLTAGLGDVGRYLAARAATGDAQATALLGGLQKVTAELPDTAALAGARERLGELDAGASAASDGAAALERGTGRLATSTRTLASGASTASDGASRLADGAGELASGVHGLHTGARALATGTASLATGADQAASGADHLSAGGTTLADALHDGAAQLPDDTAAQRSARAAAISDPVTLDSTSLARAHGLGEGFAPLFLPLALFVGGIITWLLLRPLPSRALATPAAGWRAALAGYLPAAAIGVGQVALLLGVVVLALGLHVANPVGTVAFLVLVAATFLAVQQMLIAVLGSAAGKVATIALLMLQLTSASGTYPVETTPAFFRALHPYLPMTYAVQGLRDLITGTADARLWTGAAVLVVMLVASLAVTSWKAARMRTWTIGRLHPSLSI